MLFVAGVIGAGVIHPDIPLPFIATIVAFPVAAIVLGSIARRHSGRQARAGWARAAVIAGGIELGLIVVFVILLPQLCRAREPANRIKCSGNLRQIGMALQQYAHDNGGEFPPSFGVLFSKSDLTANVFVCPSGDDKPAPGDTPDAQARNRLTNPHSLSYVYAGVGLTIATATPDAVLVYEHSENHKKEGMNILFGDGHVEFVGREESEWLISEITTGHNPPRPRTRH